MKNLKKLPTKQLEKFSNIFTQLGLVLVLFVVYVTLEHQTEQKTIAVYDSENTTTIYIEPDTEVLFKKEVKVKPVAQVHQPKVFIPDEIKKGDDDIIETVIDEPAVDPVEINLDAFVEIKEPEKIGPETVPFINIEDAPVFKGCEGLSKEENKVCFDKKMKQFVQQNFDAGLASELGLNAGRYKIQTQFLIDAKGNVVDIKIRAPHKQLEKETNRLIKKLPKFTPGMQRKKPVRVRYTLPISFSVE
ncbi:energy transducer TonB [uncultured Polaribacter sp.]|uniref:energy transducer TonB n=1 Tax=uncultured Polaribacter sp. TaxID=174711 RepID=UPI0026341C22|nr:energy transducer TonB [uncultured Polaribacter sp.]